MCGHVIVMLDFFSLDAPSLPYTQGDEGTSNLQELKQADFLELLFMLEQSEQFMRNGDLCCQDFSDFNDIC